MSNTAKSQEDWNNHLAECMPAIMTSSKALQILVGTDSAIPFDPPVAFPFTWPNDTKDDAKKEKKSYLKIMRRAGGTWHAGKGEKKLSAGETSSSVNFTDARMRKQNPNCKGTSHLAKVVPSQSEEIEQKIPKYGPMSDNVKTSNRRNELRKVASFNAASLIDRNGGSVQSRRYQATIQPASSLNAPVLGPPLDFGSNSLLWNVSSKNDQTSQISIAWMIPGLGLTMLLWQEYLFNLPQVMSKTPPTNQIPVRNINFVRTRPSPSEILLYISNEMSSSFQMSVNFVRLPRSQQRVSRNASNFSEDDIIESWIFVFMIDLNSVKQSRGSIVALTDVFKTEEATWTMVAFPTKAVSRSFERRTLKGHAVTRYELCSSGRWPLIDAQHANISSWLPWLDAAAIGAAAIEFEV